MLQIPLKQQLPAPKCYTNSTKMLQILWKMRGSNSKMLQRQLKWQLQLQNASNRKDNGQKSRSKKKTKTKKKYPKQFRTLILIGDCMITPWTGNKHIFIEYVSAWLIEGEDETDPSAIENGHSVRWFTMIFLFKMLVFHRYARNYPLGYQMLGFSKDMYQPFKKPMLGISQFFWE